MKLPFNASEAKAHAIMQINLTRQNKGVGINHKEIRFLRKNDILASLKIVECRLHIEDNLGAYINTKLMWYRG